MGRMMTKGIFFFLWCLWRWRNDITFQNMRTTMEEKISLVQRYVKEVRTSLPAQCWIFVIQASLSCLKH